MSDYDLLRYLDGPIRLRPSTESTTAQVGQWMGDALAKRRDADLLNPPERKRVPDVPRMPSRAALIAYLRLVEEEYDPEIAHTLADRALLAFIGDAEVVEAYDAVSKWYV